MYSHGRSLVKELADQPFALVGVNSDEDLKIARKAVTDENLTWRSFFDGGTKGPIATAWGVRGWPTIYIIDEKGIIRAEGLRGKQLDAKIRELLGKTR